MPEAMPVDTPPADTGGKRQWLLERIQSFSFGVELEYTGLTRKDAAHALQAALPGGKMLSPPRHPRGGWEVLDNRRRVWKVVHDASLSNAPEHQRVEVVTPILGYGDIPVLQEVVRKLRSAGARVTQQTGMHIHVGTESFSVRELMNLARLFYRQEELILMALQVPANRLGRYCKPIPEAFIRGMDRRPPQTRADLNRLWYGQFREQIHRYHNSRYATVNFNSVFLRESLEIRAFNSSTHAGEVKAMLHFALALAARARTVHSASSQRRPLGGSPKYQMRTFLLNLGLIGEEFKTARLHLLKNLPGDIAFKHGRPPLGEPEENTTDAPEPTHMQAAV